MVDSPGFRNRATLPRSSVPLDPVYNIDVNSAWQQNNLPLLIRDDDAIRGKFFNTLILERGTEHYEPLAGSLILYRIFDGINSTTETLVRMDTIDAITDQMAEEVTVYPNECSLVEADDGDGYVIVVVGRRKNGTPVEWRSRLPKNV